MLAEKLENLFSMKKHKSLLAKKLLLVLTQRFAGAPLSSPCASTYTREVVVTDVVPSFLMASLSEITNKDQDGHDKTKQDTPKPRRPR